MTNIELLPASEADETFLVDLFVEANAAILLPAALPPAMAAQLLNMQYRGQKMSYRAQFPNGENSVVWLGGERIGRLYLNESPDELRVVDMALCAGYRGRGLGRRLLEDVGERAREKGMPARLSVRTGSPAGRLYERVGFVAVSATETHIEMEWNVQGRSATAVLLPETETRATAGAGSQRLDASSAGFRSLLGHELRVELDGGGEVLMRVLSVRELVASQAGIVANDSFAVTFLGPAEPLLGSAVYSLSYGEGGSTAVFLSPVRRRAEGIEYEAVYNRMLPG